MASVIVTTGDQKGEFLPLGRRTSVIGRAENLPLQVRDDLISRKQNIWGHHAQFKTQISCRRNSLHFPLVAVRTAW
jgi:hypothetical protein